MRCKVKLLEIILRPSHTHFGLSKTYQRRKKISWTRVFPRPVQEKTEKKSRLLLCRLHLWSLTWQPRVKTTNDRKPGAFVFGPWIKIPNRTLWRFYPLSSAPTFTINILFSEQTSFVLWRRGSGGGSSTEIRWSRQITYVRYPLFVTVRFFSGFNFGNKLWMQPIHWRGRRVEKKTMLAKWCGCPNFCIQSTSRLPWPELGERQQGYYLRKARAVIETAFNRLAPGSVADLWFATMKSMPFSQSKPDDITERLVETYNLADN